MPSSANLARAASAMVAAALVFGPSISPAASQRDRRPHAAGEQLGAVVDVDPLTATGDEIVTTLGRIDDLVRDHAAAAAAARDAHAVAAAQVAAATEVRQQAEERVVELDPAAAAAAVVAAVAPGAVGAAATASLAAPTPFGTWHARSGFAAPVAPGGPVPPGEARTGPDASWIALDEAWAALDAATDVLHEAATEAGEKDAAVEAAAAALADAEAQQAAFVAEIEERVAANLADAEAIAPDDADRADALRAEEQAISESLAEIAPAREDRPTDAEAPTPAPAPEPPAPEPAPEPPAPPPLPDPTGSASGAVAAVACPTGGWLVVDSSIAGNVQALVDDAQAGGVGMCAKSGFRSRAQQIELRRANCGSSDHAIFDAPPSTCSPPTARPGTSNHESGLAVDFSCADGQPMTHASPCFQWLAAHAAGYGLHNLPSEPWHWSVTGR